MPRVARSPIGPPEIIKRFDSYAEISPSATGVKLFFLMSAADSAKLRNLLGHDFEGNQLTRKTFAAGKHREVAIDTARFYAVTNQPLKGSRKNFRLVPFADVEWFVMHAGPAYLAQQGNGHDNTFEDFWGRTPPRTRRKRQRLRLSLYAKLPRRWNERAAGMHGNPGRSI